MEHVKVHDVTYLSAMAGRVDGEASVILTIRPDEDSFRPHNLSITAEQALHLRQDLNRIFERSRTIRLWLAEQEREKVEKVAILDTDGNVWEPE